jgi:hypothetical protein
MGTRLQAQGARRRLDEFGTRTVVVGALGISVETLSSISLTLGAQLSDSVDGGHRWPRPAPSMCWPT